MAQCLPSQIKVLSADPQVIAAQDADGARQLESLSPSISGIEQDHVAPSLEARNMRVAKDDSVGFLTPEQLSHLGARRAGIEDVAKHKLEAAEHKDLDLPRTEITVTVTLDGGDWRDPLKVAQHGISADVAGVQDVVDAGEEFRHLLVEDAVGVGDYADCDHASIRLAPLFTLEIKQDSIRTTLTASHAAPQSTVAPPYSLASMRASESTDERAMVSL